MRSRIQRAFLPFVFFCLLFPLTVFSSNPPSLQNKLKLAIDQKITSLGLKRSSLAVIISQGDESKPQNPPLYRLNAEKQFIPASLVKIPLLSALYGIYPVSYTFKTTLLSSAEIKDGVLLGDVILKGGGDSSFTSENMWNLVNTFSRTKVQSISGDLVVDESLYEKEPPFFSLSERSYSARSSSASFNWNSVSFRVRPAKHKRGAALVFIDPEENNYLRVINKIKTGSKNKIKIRRLSAYSKTTKETFELKGEINQGEEELVFYRNITQPALWMGWNAKAFLSRRGIKVLGKVKSSASSEFCSKELCRELAVEESRPFPFYGWNLMKFSSNLTARMLAIHIPLLEGKSQGSLKGGMQRIRSYLKQEMEQEMRLGNFHLEEPSGLSRKNRFSAQDLHKLLKSEKSFFRPEMLFAYPISGGQGTLKDRFKDLSPDNKVFVRAKTGSLSGVLGLAGWAAKDRRAPDSHYTFVFIFNGKESRKTKAKKLFDEVIYTLMRPSPLTSSTQ